MPYKCANCSWQEVYEDEKRKREEWETIATNLQQMNRELQQENEQLKSELHANRQKIKVLSGNTANTGNPYKVKTSYKI